MRERQVMELVGQGLKNREVAMQLGIRPGTVKVHLMAIFKALDVRNRTEAVLAAQRRVPGAWGWRWQR